MRRVLFVVRSYVLFAVRGLLSAVVWCWSLCVCSFVFCMLFVEVRCVMSVVCGVRCLLCAVCWCLLCVVRFVLLCVVCRVFFVFAMR